MASKLKMGCFKPDDPQRRASKELQKKIALWMKSYNNIIKMLLLGPGESGKTTIIKQMKIIHVNGFTQEERMKKAEEIRRNVLEAIKELTGNMEYLRPPIMLADSANEGSLNFIRNVSMIEEYHFPQEFYDHTKRLWTDRGIQECYSRSSEFQLIESAKYFLERIDTVREENYSPTDQDILCCRKRTSDIQKIEFEVQIDKKLRGQQFWMFDVGGQRGERRKWIQVFDGITAVLFLAACNGFDLRIREDNETNRLKEALALFEDVWFSRFLRSSGFILFLNKQDKLEEKIRSGVKLENSFPEYANYSPKGDDDDTTDEYKRARSFIKDQFMLVTTKPPPQRKYSAADVYYGNGEHRSRQCFWHYTTATDTDNIQKVFNDVHTMVIMWNVERIGPY